MPAGPLISLVAGFVDVVAGASLASQQHPGQCAVPQWRCHTHAVHAYQVRRPGHCAGAQAGAAVPGTFLNGAGRMPWHDFVPVNIASWNLDAAPLWLGHHNMA